MSAALHRFYFGQEDAFLIPVEHLSPRGVDPGFAETVRAERGLSQAWTDRFDAALAAAFARTGQLFDRARPLTLGVPRRLVRHPFAGAPAACASWASA